MEISGARVLVAGATGTLGGVLTAEPAGRGARPALAGRPGPVARTALPVAGAAPPLPAGGDPYQLVKAVVAAPATDAALLRTGPDKTPAVERRAR